MRMNMISLLFACFASTFYAKATSVNMQTNVSNKQIDSSIPKSTEIDSSILISTEIDSTIPMSTEIDSTMANSAKNSNQPIVIIDQLTTVDLTDITEQSTSLIRNEASKAKLKTLLSSMAFFSADFLQQVFDEESSLIGQHQGRLIVSKPNLVRWHTLTPDETLIVSDGKVLWLFDPFIEQASVYTLDAAIANTPILLLSSDDDALWENYTVSQIAEATYQIQAKDINSRIKTLELHFAPEDVTNSKEFILTSLSLMDTTGQLSVIALSNINNTNRPAPDLFNFSLPEGVDLDDQR